MAAWLTTHYPHISETHPWNVYLKDEYRNKADKISAGDQVFFYELKGKKRSGSGAVVRMAKATSKRGLNPCREGSIDEDGQYWKWYVECTGCEKGCIDGEALDKILGRPFSRWPQVRGGIFELKKPVVEQLEREFERKRK